MTQEPAVLRPGPSMIGVTLGGLVGTALSVSLTYAAPLWGATAVDLLRTCGGVFTSNAAAALGVGFILVVAFGVIVWPSAIFLAWPYLPGTPLSMGGAVQKGIVSGIVAWAIFGIALWLGTALNGAMPGTTGAFAIRAGAAGAFSFLVGAVLYGVAVTVVAAMESAISPLDTLGWSTFYHAAATTRDFGAHRSTPEWIPEHARHD